MQIILLLFTHFIADFILQSRKMGQRKSQYFNWLVGHVVIQHFSMLITMMYITEGNWRVATVFSFFNAFLHGIVDWYLWKLYKIHAIKIIKKNRIRIKDFRYWEDRWFYITIGFDQFLHISTIIILWEILR